MDGTSSKKDDDDHDDDHEHKHKHKRERASSHQDLVKELEQVARPVIRDILWSSCASRQLLDLGAISLASLHFVETLVQKHLQHQRDSALVCGCTDIVVEERSTILSHPKPPCLVILKELDKVLLKLIEDSIGT